MKIKTAGSVTFLAVLLATEVTAQTVFPQAYTNVATYEQSLLPFGGSHWRTQVALAEAKGQALAIQDVSFRRGHDTRLASHVLRTVTMQMGNCNFAGLGSQYATNFTAPPTTVLKASNVRLPNWGSAPPSIPAPFDFVLPLAATYVHTGTEDLMIDLEVAGYRPANAYLESISTAGIARGSSTTLFPGCVNPGPNAHQTGFYTEQKPSRLELSMLTLNATPSAAGLFLVGASDPYIRPPGFCAALRSSGEFALPFRTDPGGSHRVVASTTASPAALAGIVLYGQSVVADSAGWFTLGNGIRLQMPDPNPAPLPVRSVSGLGNAAQGSLIESTPILRLR